LSKVLCGRPDMAMAIYNHAGHLKDVTIYMKITYIDYSGVEGAIIVFSSLRVKETKCVSTG